MSAISVAYNGNKLLIFQNIVNVEYYIPSKDGLFLKIINRKFLKSSVYLIELNRLVGIREALDSNLSSKTNTYLF
ncbi:hypothetical protein SAMN05443253_10329 [Bacillus sp. OK048]|nr:hypothetical protein SAMN05443253_10329 [Bacillus sp. OK048]